MNFRGAVKKIDNILKGNDNSDISEPERRKYQEIKDDILRFKTAPEMNLIAEGDLGDKRVQEELGIGGKFNPDDPNLPVKIRERIEEARAEGKEVTYFYDKVTGKIYINENADEKTVRAGIGREWGIRDRFEKGKAKANTEGELKATVAGEIAYSEIEKRLKGKGNKGINLKNFDYAVFDNDSEVTGDFTDKHIKKGIGRIISATEKAFEGDYKGSIKIIKETVTDTGRVLKRDKEEYDKGGVSRKKVVEESTKAIKSTSNIVVGEVGKAIEKQRIARETGKKKLEEELSSKNCNGRCIKEQQKTYDDVRKDTSQLLSCRTGSKDCNPKPNNTSELIIFKTDREMEEYSAKLKKYGIRGNYRLDSEERIERNYNNSSVRGKQAIDYERVMNKIRDEGKSAEELYRTGKISNTQYRNYTKEVDYIKTVNGYGYIVNNVISPIYNSVYLGVMSNKGKTSETTGVEKSSTGIDYVKRDSRIINDGTPQGSVKYESQIVGNKDFEVRKITNVSTGEWQIDTLDKRTGAIYSKNNIGSTTSKVPLLTDKAGTNVQNTSGTGKNISLINKEVPKINPEIVEVSKNTVGNKQKNNLQSQGSISNQKNIDLIKRTGQFSNGSDYTVVKEVSGKVEKIDDLLTLEGQAKLKNMSVDEIKNLFEKEGLTINDLPKTTGTGIGERFNIQGKGTQINNIRTNSNGKHGMDYIQIGTVNQGKIKIIFGSPKDYNLISNTKEGAKLIFIEP